MDQIEVDILIGELKCIKLRSDERAYVDASAVQFKNGNFSNSVVLRIQAIARRNKVKLEELRVAREKAKRSIWKKKNGVTEEQLADLVNAREAMKSAKKSDLGI
jgi:hypothetical protein